MRKRFFPRVAFVALSPLLTPFIVGCSLGLTDVPDPSTILDPELVNTQTGAVGLYSESVSQFHRAYAGAFPGTTSLAYSFTFATGIASDEFEGYSQAYSLRRVGPDGIGNEKEPYASMHKTRMQIDQAIGALKKYGLTSPTSYIAQLYAYRGYLSVMFGELYCSGVPFSRAVYGGDIEFGQPFTTTQMFERAIAEFDSALAISTDSVNVTRLAYVGKARALLNLGRFSEAAAVASETNIPNGFRYDITFSATVFPNYFYGATANDFFSSAIFGMANRMGSNGLGYLEAGADTGVAPARAPIDARMRNYAAVRPATFRYPSKFATGSSPIPLADWIEARLIQAEAQFQEHKYDDWATTLNGLRQDGTTTPVIPLTADSTTSADQILRENVMFRERAFWLYGTGHRFGDLRRMIRQYGRTALDVFPTGIHPLLQSPNNVFSDRVSFEPPKTEMEANPNYKGCINYDA